MICPQCHAEMKEGYLPSNGTKLQWIPQDEPAPWIRWGLASGAVQLAPFSLLTNVHGIAYYCASCEWVIIPRNTKAE